ncbi:MAG: hypothetical protein AAGD38_04725 [Acidobacteriota bacterium]
MHQKTIPFQILALCLFLSLWSSATISASVDHGDGCASATQVPIGGSAPGWGDYSRDRDYFSVQVDEPGLLVIEARPSSASTPPWLQFLGRDCWGSTEVRALARNDLQQVLAIETAGRYFFRVQAQGDGGGYQVRTELLRRIDRADIELQDLGLDSSVCPARPAFRDGDGTTNGDDTVVVVDPPAPTTVPGLGSRDGDGTTNGDDTVVVVDPPQPMQWRPTLYIRDGDGTTNGDDTVVVVDPPAPIMPPADKGRSLEILTSVWRVDLGAEVGGLPVFDRNLGVSVHGDLTDDKETTISFEVARSGWLSIGGTGGVFAGLYDGDACTRATQHAAHLHLDQSEGAYLVPVHPGRYTVRLGQITSSGAYRLDLRLYATGG